jgi:putative FmdB family regulatory protein
MPIYDYRCASCGGTFETLTRTDAPVPACPSCKASDVRRLLPLVAAPIRTSGADAACDDGACASPGGGCGGGACARLN